MSELLLINGPNLNLLGSREPKHYGAKTLVQIEADLGTEAQRLGHRLQTYQSNHEGELVNRIHKAKSEGVSFILINPAGYTHSSVALRDALLAVSIPFIEIHLSNTYAREPFRRHSYLSDIARGVIVGLGAQGYRLALLAAHAQISSTH
ncbi:MAG: type II 3-dehydroquinate dehydratase [Nevskiales bacterium]|nr:type II 3-dehydroquinate dehydratase [Nevskiales bacterium]